MIVQPHARVSKLMKRTSLPTDDLPNEKRQRVTPHIEKGLTLSRPMRELPHKLCGKRKRMSELDENRRVSMLLETRELPEELIQVEILTRLPIKSVGRFKSVCKSWLSLFSSPQFAKEHRAHQNPDDYDCLVAKCSDNTENSDTVVIFSRFEEKFVQHLNQTCSLIGSAKGLVCIHRDNTFSLWNPTIHQSKEIQLPILDSISLRSAGFGFDPVTNDYKVAICYRLSSSLSLWYAVYSSNSDSWFESQFDDPGLENLISKFGHSKTPTTMVKDCPYWKCDKRVSSVIDKEIKSLAAVKFDATNNKFKLLPEFCYEVSCHKINYVVNMKDLLTLMTYDNRTLDKVDIYSLDEEKGCGGVWSKMYSFGPFKHFADLRFRLLRPGFNYGDEIVYFDYCNIYRHDHKTDARKRIPVTKPDFDVCFTYNPSLVLLQGMNYLENQSPPLGHASHLDNSSVSNQFKRRQRQMIACFVDNFRVHV